VTNWRWRAAERTGPAVVFDMDGVLSNAVGRQHYLDRGHRQDWKSFFEAAGEDPLIDEVARLVELLDRDLVVVLLTARPVRIRDLTVDWLQRHGLRWDLLVMRPGGDFDTASEFKRRTVHELRDAGLELRLAFEDDRRNVEMFHSEGVPCIYIHSGYYD
jgi:hypothetical protein